MRFTINKNEFLKGLLIASRAIGSKSVNPTLLGFKLEMNNDGLEITAFGHWSLQQKEKKKSFVISLLAHP